MTVSAVNSSFSRCRASSSSFCSCFAKAPSAVNCFSFSISSSCSFSAKAPFAVNCFSFSFSSSCSCCAMTASAVNCFLFLHISSHSFLNNPYSSSSSSPEPPFKGFFLYQSTLPRFGGTIQDLEFKSPNMKATLSFSKLSTGICTLKYTGI